MDEVGEGTAEKDQAGDIKAGVVGKRGQRRLERGRSSGLSMWAFLEFSCASGLRTSYNDIQQNARWRHKISPPGDNRSFWALHLGQSLAQDLTHSRNALLLVVWGDTSSLVAQFLLTLDWGLSKH